MENLRKRINAKLVNNAKDFLKYTSKPTYITLLFMKLNRFQYLSSKESKKKNKNKKRS